MIVRDPKGTWKYVLLKDRKLPRADQTVFELRHLTLSDEARLFDNLDRDSSGIPIRKELGSERLNLLRRNLAGWSGMKRGAGGEVAYEATPMGLCKDDLLFQIPPDDRHELALAIENELSFDPDEVGKSSPQPDSVTAAS